MSRNSIGSKAKRSYAQSSTTAEASNRFRKTIEIATGQSAKWWELRATVSLARLMAKQGKRDDERAMLAETYGWFTEGFNTADPKDAKALLEEMENRPHPPTTRISSAGPMIRLEVTQMGDHRQSGLVCIGWPARY